MKKNARSRNWCIVLYPDNPDHCKVYKRIHDRISVSILHDKDELEGDFENEEDYKAIKKLHWHCLITYDNPRHFNGVVDDLQIPLNDIHLLQQCFSVVSYLKYMIHYGYNDKHQYDISLLTGDINLIRKLKKAMKNDGLEEETKVQEIIEFIFANRNKPLTFKEFSRFVCENGRWDVYRRSAIIFKDLILESNTRYFDERNYDYD